MLDHMPNIFCLNFFIVSLLDTHFFIKPFSYLNLICGNGKIFALRTLFNMANEGTLHDICLDRMYLRCHVYLCFSLPVLFSFEKI